MFLRLVCCCLALVLTATIVRGQGQPSSLWRHNNSVMGLFADGQVRVFRYEQPREGMREEGVRKGTTLFEGTKSGETYEGTAYVFSQRCGAIAYSVSGTVSTDSRQVILTGQAPSRLDSNCQPTAYRDDVLQFDYIKSFGSAPEVGSTPLICPQRVVRLEC